MERESVESSNLQEVGYDPDTEVLEIMFKNDRVYQYFNFPPFMYERFIEAASLGKFFNSEIKGSFPEERI